MAKAILQNQQRNLFQQERQLASELQRCLANFEGTDAYTIMLRQVTDALDDLFLLVTVGEFNAGKSACINALLHKEVLEEGVIPTTRQVSIVRYGEQNKQRQLEGNILEITYPAAFLRDISIVDTPGINAVLREHEKLTTEFVPRSDLILFIASVDRPFTESERLFLERVRSWGKKMIIILNKIDLLRTPAALNQVMHFVSESCKQLLGFQPQIFPVSALLAARSREAMGHDAIGLWEESRFGALENHLFRTLDEAERVRLKLLSPLGVMQRLLTQTKNAVQQRASLLTEDAHTVGTIEEQQRLYREDMEMNFTHRLSEIENIVLEMRNRGDHFFDETIRLGRIVDLIQGQRIREEFGRVVVGDSEKRIDQAVQELIDWLVEHEHRLWQDIMEYLDRRRQTSFRRDDAMIGSVSRQFDYNRRTLLQSVARTASSVVTTYDHEAESAGLSQTMRNAVAQTALAGAGGIGLGAAVVALAGTAAADISGILAGTLILSLGFYIIPTRRKRAKRDFDAKMQDLRLRLHSSLEEQFRKELTNSLSRVQDAIAPYTRFVRSEQQKTTTIQQQVNHLDSSLFALKNEIENTDETPTQTLA